jgi:hypothetical protein
MPSPEDIALLPDAGPLITLAYAGALDLLFKPGWSVTLVDMVLHELTRSQTPTSAAIAAWAVSNSVPVLPTRVFWHFQQTSADSTVRKAGNLGETAVQEIMNEFAIMAPPRIGVFLFEDHRIARASFLVPDNCRKVSTRAFLSLLEHKGWLRSAVEIERRAIQAGRAFSQLRFPPE